MELFNPTRRSIISSDINHAVQLQRFGVLLRDVCVMIISGRDGWRKEFNFVQFLFRFRSIDTIKNLEKFGPDIVSKIRISKWSIKFLHTPYIISYFYSFLTLYLNFFKIFHLYNFKIRISYTDPKKDTFSNFHQHLNLCLQLPGVSFFFTTHNSSTMIPFITIVALQHKKVLTSRSLRDTQFLNYMINNTRPSTPEKYEILENKKKNH